MSAFDADPGVRPSFRQFTDYAVAWEPIPDDGLRSLPGAAPLLSYQECVRPPSTRTDCPVT